MSNNANAALVACMRNEGLFIVEWVAYHRVIGFDRIVICSNDCTDGSDTLLDLLAQFGAIDHLRNTVPPETAPQDSGMRAAFAHLDPTDIEWIAHIDADEFLNIGLGDGHISDLLARAGGGDVIALPWWAFGDSGHKHWPGSVLEHFTYAEEHPIPERCKFKSMFRFRDFEHASDHRPIGPKKDNTKVRSVEGKGLNATILNTPERSKYRPFDRSIQPQAACVNHYAVPSRDVFLMKNDRGDGQATRSDKYMLGSRWHQIANQNTRQNLSIQRHLGAVQNEMARLRAQPDINAAETRCKAWLTARSAALLTPEQIRKWSKPQARDTPA